MTASISKTYTIDDTTALYKKVGASYIATFSTDSDDMDFFLKVNTMKAKFKTVKAVKAFADSISCGCLPDYIPA